MIVAKSVYKEKKRYAFYKTFMVPTLRFSSNKCLPSIFLNFFFSQFRSAFLPGRVKISRADHPLDEKIPFVPSWITIYLDFVGFWIRLLSFFLRRYGRRVYKYAGDFILSIGKLYAFASVVYRKNLSTTKRPFYIASPRFFLIHLVDPHLMCVPSLHIMIAVYTYKMFEFIAGQFGDKENLKEQIEEMKYGAIAISHAVLFVKQHSVNCIPAALYTMTCYCPELFPPDEAEAFIRLLFSPVSVKAPKGCRVHPASSPFVNISEEAQLQIKDHIIGLYRRFIEEKENTKSWEEPILKFLNELPKVN